MEEVKNAFLVEGEFKGVKDGKLVIYKRFGGEAMLSPGFNITPKFLTEWMGKAVCFSVVNDRAVQIKEKLFITEKLFGKEPKQYPEAL
jgi:hypothetical protein